MHYKWNYEYYKRLTIKAWYLYTKGLHIFAPWVKVKIIQNFLPFSCFLLCLIILSTLSILNFCFISLILIYIFLKFWWIVIRARAGNNTVRVIGVVCWTRSFVLLLSILKTDFFENFFFIFLNQFLKLKFKRNWLDI